MMLYPQFRYVPAGDSALVVELGDEISPIINQRIRALLAALERQPLPGIREYLPTYRSLMIQYDPVLLWFEDVRAHVRHIETQIVDLPVPEPRIITVPVAYGGRYGPDLSFVAQHARLTEAEVIALHAGRDYLVYMLGFTPGFCYLGGLAEQLEIPRLATPRTQIPAGSVGLAGQQTGMYPIDSPGGWQIIGRTPITLFDPSREPVVLIHAGDYVRFTPITEADYQRLVVQVEQGTCILQIEAGSPISVLFPKNTTGMNAITVLQPGLLTTIQDLGRWGFQSIGMPVAGVMDDYAARVGNLLIGNPENTPVLEITLVGPTVRFGRATMFVVTGGDWQPQLNDQSVANWTVYPAQAQDVLSFAGLCRGCRAYLAVAGGFCVENVMGSASTYLRGKLGGYHGRALQTGDALTTGIAASALLSAPLTLPAEYLPEYYDTLRVILGPQDDAFTEHGIATFFSSEYIVTNDADRMGYRLEGPQIEHARGADIISDGIALGAIQVPAQGTPIIMLADRQTTGGYPKIAHVITVDIPSVAQKKPGDKIRFKQVSIRDAQEAYRQRQARLTALQQCLERQRHPVSPTRAAFFVALNGQRYAVTIQEL